MEPQAEHLELADRIAESLNATQRRVREDPARRKSVMVGRRGGKTYGEAADFIIDGLRCPQSNYAYITLYKETARNILWDNPKTGLRALDQKFGLNSHVSNSQNVLTLPSGSRIALYGAKREADLDKLRGQAFKKAKIDECKSFAPARLKVLIDDVLRPTLADEQGSLTLMGTPGTVLAGPFFEATCLAAYGDLSRIMETTTVKCHRYGDPPTKLWSLHQWSVADNTALPHLWQEALSVKSANEWADSNPTWIREWLGLWILDLSLLVYRYDQEHNWSGASNLLPRGKWNNVLAFYHTLSDELGLVVWSYADDQPGLYQRWDRRLERATTEHIAREVKVAEQMFGEFEIVIGAREGGGKEIFRDLNENHGLPVIEGSLRQVSDLVVLMNSDMEAGRVHALEGSDLSDELIKLQWVDPGAAMDDSVSKVLSTATLFAWRYSYHRDYRVQETRPKPGTPEFLEARAEEELRKADEAYLRDSMMGPLDKQLEGLRAQDEFWASLLKD